MDGVGGGSDPGTTRGAFSFKVVLLGEGCVGKTSLVLRYVEDKFNDKHESTVQVMLTLDNNCNSCINVSIVGLCEVIW